MFLQLTDAAVTASFLLLTLMGTNGSGSRIETPQRPLSLPQFNSTEPQQQSKLQARAPNGLGQALCQNELRLPNVQRAFYTIKDIK